MSSWFWIHSRKEQEGNVSSENGGVEISTWHAGQRIHDRTVGDTCGRNEALSNIERMPASTIVIGIEEDESAVDVTNQVPIFQRHH